MMLVLSPPVRAARALLGCMVVLALGGQSVPVVRLLVAETAVDVARRWNAVVAT